MYIPKNRIQTNLYTSGGEYIVAETQQEYVGFYHKLYTGKAFTGKNPDDSRVLGLIPTLPSSLESSSPTLQLAVFVNNNDLNFLSIRNPELLNQNNLPPYLSARQQLTNDNQSRFIPFQYYPSPSPQDYQLGVFTRYFVYKINTIEFIEVNKEIYENIKTKNPNWAWEFYNFFSIPWELTGNKEKTYLANRNTTLLAERRNRAPGLSKFLRENYLKFYKE